MIMAAFCKPFGKSDQGARRYQFDFLIVGNRVTPTDIETKQPLESGLPRGWLNGQIFSLNRLPHVFGTDGEALKSDFTIVVDARHSGWVCTEAS